MSENVLHLPDRKKMEFCDHLKHKYMCDKEFSLESYMRLERMFGDEYFYNGLNINTALHSAAGREVYRYRYNMLAMGRTDIDFGKLHFKI